MADILRKSADIVLTLALLREELHRLLKKTENDSFYDSATRKRIKETVEKLHAVLTSDAQTPHGLKKRLEEVPSREVHYRRNDVMPLDILPQTPAQAKEWGWNDKVNAACHQFTSPDKSNIKFVSPDGKDEVIFDKEGRIVTASEDYGTYNFSDPSTDPIGHFYEDVLPWLLWGNDEKDTTNMNQRLEAFVVDGSATTVAEKIVETEGKLANVRAQYEEIHDRIVRS